MLKSENQGERLLRFKTRFFVIHFSHQLLRSENQRVSLLTRHFAIRPICPYRFECFDLRENGGKLAPHTLGERNIGISELDGPCQVCMSLTGGPQQGKVPP